MRCCYNKIIEHFQGLRRNGILYGALYQLKQHRIDLIRTLDIDCFGARKMRQVSKQMEQCTKNPLFCICIHGSLHALRPAQYNPDVFGDNWQLGYDQENKSDEHVFLMLCFFPSHIW